MIAAGRGPRRLGRRRATAEPSTTSLKTESVNQASVGMNVRGGLGRIRFNL
jgi:hypothetical protein